MSPHRLCTVASRVRGAIALLALVTGLTTVPPAQANWVPLPGGKPVCTAPGNQDHHALCPDGFGGAVIAWVDERSGVGQIYAQRLDADGEPLWTADGVQVSPTTAWQSLGEVIPENDGGALIVWTDLRAGASNDIYAQRLTATGAVAPGWPTAGKPLTTRTQEEQLPRACSDGAGGAFVTWELMYAPDPQIDWDIYANHVTGSGAIAAGWDANGNALALTSGIEKEPAIASDGYGGAYVCWEDGRTAPAGLVDVFGVRVAGDGSLVSGWTPGGTAIVQTAAASEDIPRLIPVGDAGVIAFFQRWTESTGYSVRAQRVSPNGVRQWDAEGLPLGGGFNPCGGAPDGAGGAILLWNADSGPMVVHLDVNGGPAPGWPREGIDLSGGRLRWHYPGEIASDGAGGAVITWLRYGGAEGEVVEAQHVTADGRLAWPWGGLILKAANVYWPMIASDGAGGAIVAWWELEAPAWDWNIYATQVNGLSNLMADDTPPGWSGPVVPRASGDATPGAVTVPATLPGNEESTWLNWHITQAGPSAVPAFQSALWLDEDPDAETWLQDFASYTPPDTVLAMLNLGPIGVRGGRHSLTSLTDTYPGIPESNESDDYARVQWIWSPLPVTARAPRVRLAPPLGGQAHFSEPNSDGFSFDRTPNMAWVVAEAPLDAGDDYDLLVYDDYSGSTSGFSQVIGGSGSTGDLTDFVVGHYAGTPYTVYPAVICPSSGGGMGPYVLDQNDAARRNATTPPQAWAGQLMTGNRLVDVYEFSLTAGQTYYFHLERTAGASDISFAMYSPMAGGVWGRGNAVDYAQALGPDSDHLVFTATEKGWHPLVVYRDRGTGAGAELRYTLTWDDSPLVSVPGEPPAATLGFAGAAPNPATSSARLDFSLASPGRVRLALYDVNGRQARVLADGEFGAGPHAVTWDIRGGDGTRVGAGVYWARFEGGGRVITRRVAVLR